MQARVASGRGPQLAALLRQIAGYATALDDDFVARGIERQLASLEDH